MAHGGHRQPLCLRLVGGKISVCLSCVYVLDK